MPALLALASAQDITLGETLLALVTGYEIGVRAGEAWRIPPGWHVDGSWHSLAVAAAVARIQCGPAGIQPAIEAASCQLPASLYLPITEGSVLRNTYPAHAVLLGMLAAGAAKARFPMPRGAFEEARQRVLRASAAAPCTPAGDWTIRSGYLKPFAGVRHTHYAVAACLRLRQRAGFSIDAIAAIRLQTYPEATQYCGNRAPGTAIQAQFSLSYAVAAALVLGDLGPDAYATMHDPAIARLERLVVVEADPARTTRSASVSIDIAGQTLTEHGEDVAGDPANPMTREQVIGKFQRYAGPTLGPTRTERFVASLLGGNLSVPMRACLSLET